MRELALLRFAVCGVAPQGGGVRLDRPNLVDRMSLAATLLDVYPREGESKLIGGVGPQAANRPLWEGDLDPGDVATATKSLPTFCFPSGVPLTSTPERDACHSFLLTLSSGAGLYGECLVMTEQVQTASSGSPKAAGADARRGPYVRRAVCLLSRFAIHDEMRALLLSLRTAMLSPRGPRVRLEAEIVHLMSAALLPAPGHALRLTVAGSRVTLRSPVPGRELPPASSRAVAQAVAQIGVPLLCTLVRIALQHPHLLVHSGHPPLHSTVVLAVLTLMWPVEWQGIALPVVAEEAMLKGLMAAPVPWIMGARSGLVCGDGDSSNGNVHHDSKNNDRSGGGVGGAVWRRLMISDDVVVCDLESGTVSGSAEVMADIAPFPPASYKVLIRDLESCVSPKAWHGRGGKPASDKLSIPAAIAEFAGASKGYFRGLRNALRNLGSGSGSQSQPERGNRASGSLGASMSSLSATSSFPSTASRGSSGSGSGSTGAANANASGTSYAPNAPNGGSNINHSNASGDATAIGSSVVSWTSPAPTRESSPDVRETAASSGVDPQALVNATAVREAFAMFIARCFAGMRMFITGKAPENARRGEHEYFHAKGFVEFCYERDADGLDFFQGAVATQGFSSFVQRCVEIGEDDGDVALFFRCLAAVEANMALGGENSSAGPGAVFPSLQATQQVAPETAPKCRPTSEKHSNTRYTVFPLVSPWIDEGDSDAAVREIMSGLDTPAREGFGRAAGEKGDKGGEGDGDEDEYDTAVPAEERAWAEDADAYMRDNDTLVMVSEDWVSSTNDGDGDGKKKSASVSASASANLKKKDSGSSAKKKNGPEKRDDGGDVDDADNDGASVSGEGDQPPGDKAPLKALLSDAMYGNFTSANGFDDSVLMLMGLNTWDELDSTSTSAGGDDRFAAGNAVAAGGGGKADRGDRGSPSSRVAVVSELRTGDARVVIPVARRLDPELLSDQRKRNRSGKRSNRFKRGARSDRSKRAGGDALSDRSSGSPTRSYSTSSYRSRRAYSGSSSRYGYQSDAYRSEDTNGYESDAYSSSGSGRWRALTSATKSPRAVRSSCVALQSLWRGRRVRTAVLQSASRAAASEMARLVTAWEESGAPLSRRSAFFAAWVALGGSGVNFSPGGVECDDDDALGIGGNVNGADSKLDNSNNSNKAESTGGTPQRKQHVRRRSVFGGLAAVSPWKESGSGEGELDQHRVTMVTVATTPAMARLAAVRREIAKCEKVRDCAEKSPFKRGKKDVARERKALYESLRAHLATMDKAAAADASVAICRSFGVAESSKARKRQVVRALWSVPHTAVASCAVSTVGWAGIDAFVKACADLPWCNGL